MSPRVVNAANVEEQLFQSLFAELKIPPDCKSRVWEHLGQGAQSGANQAELARLGRAWQNLKLLKVWGDLSDKEYLNRLGFDGDSDH